ncbi:hypothetical protein P9G84_23715 [Brevibacillus centrosporus]|uniref:hypothetical protein n=1 Tax=Brevibacillus centrosporus TaxID=54910 RepID=UPI000F09F19B|nr:hypothetical protein [Brevibacillus centrosporus]MEC2131925.1 hypothetical protein [Brevibacillus centrosporus]RNB64038.1 hypothetical protein EDM55_28220 [Brevibacillus centrosporus]GED35090.1 hypothetical protein BCE02nite_62310 [Brevibacillus centrosporus]
MVPSILQLVGAILLGIMVAIREKNEYRKLVAIVTPIPGKVPARLRNLYQETWTFRIGLVFVVLGYGVQICNIDSDYLATLPITYKMIAASVLVVILCYIGIYFAKLIALRQFKRAKPYDPNEDPEEGEIMIK